MRHVQQGFVVVARPLFATLFALFIQLSPALAQVHVGVLTPPPGGFVRDRRHGEALAAVERLSQVGSGNDFVTAAQWVLDQPRDSISISAEGKPRSVRRTVESIVSTASKDRIGDYRRLIGPVAAADLTKSRRQESVDGLWDIVRRYFLTEAGGQATIELMIRSLDSGADDIAAALAARLSQEPAHAALLTPTVRRRMEVALRRVDRVEDTDPESQRNPSSIVVTPAPLRTENIEISRSAAVMCRPDWTIPLDFAERYPVVDARWQSWQSQQREENQSTAIASKPLVVQGQVVFRDGNRLRAVNHRTGQPSWEHVTGLGLDSLFSSTLLKNRDGDFGGAERMTLLTSLLAANAAYFSLTTDGRQIYLVDGVGAAIESLMRGTPLRDLTDEQRREALQNDLVAIHAHPQFSGENRRIWSLKELARDRESPLRDHTFLGPPTAMPGFLLAMTESDREICAVAINPETGQVRWIQPVAEPDSAVLDDRPRFFRSCTPVVARGLVLCPTQLGSLVALDVTNGSFAWVHVHVDQRQMLTRSGTFRQLPVLSQNRNSAFNLRPWLAGNRLFYLAGQNESLYCLDIATGREQWSLSQPDGEYIGHITDQAVIVVGRTAVRAYSIENSAELWSVRLPAVPSGFGLATHGEFLIPLSDGHLWRISTVDGRLLSKGTAAEQHPTGHLAMTPDGVVALGASGLTAYRFTESVRQDLVRSRVGQNFSPEQQFQLAEVSLAEGDLTAAAQLFESVRKINVPEWRARTDPLLREAYFALLSSQPEHQSLWLGRLKPLCLDGEDRVRWLVAQGDWLVSNGNVAGLTSVMRDLSASPGAVLHNNSSDTALAHSGLGWMRRVLRRLPDSPSRDQLITELTRINPESGEAHQRARSIEAIFSQTVAGENVRSRLAAHAVTRGGFHAAEVWLLRNAESADGEVAAGAVRQLAELYEQAGMATAAAVQWERLQSQFAEVHCDTDLTGRDFVRRQSTITEVAAAYRRQSPVTWPIQRVLVDSVRRPAAIADSGDRGGISLRDTGFQSDRFPRWGILPREEFDFEWRQRIEGAESILMPWDRYAQQPRFQMRLGNIVTPVGGRSVFEHSLAIGMPAKMRMVSVMQPLTDGEAWTQSLPDWEGRSAVPIPGPVTLRMQLFQVFPTRPTLVAVDPADGTVLWSRTDLDPNSGLADRNLGIFADDDVVGVMGEDRVSYRLFDATTGDFIRAGKLEAERTTWRFAVGARIIWVVNGNDGQRVRIWDAAEDRVIFEESIRERQFVSMTPDRELVWLTADEHLCVLDVKRNQMVVRCPIDSTEPGKIASLKVFRQGGRYFVNLNRSLQVAKTEHSHISLNDHALPLIQLRDDLLAIDATGTSVAWKRSVPQMGIVQWGRLPVPFLMAVSKVRNRTDNNHEWLRVDLIDPATGERLGVGDHLPRDRWVHADYDGERGEVRIHGLQNIVRIRFNRTLQQLPGNGEVL